MTCYTDFFPHYCPACGTPLDCEQAIVLSPDHDYLQGTTITCSCGVTCCYFPEHQFPYREEPEVSAIA